MYLTKRELEILNYSVYVPWCENRQNLSYASELEDLLIKLQKEKKDAE